MYFAFENSKDFLLQQISFGKNLLNYEKYCDWF